MSAMNPDATTMQKRVLKPKFHPTVSPDRSSRKALIVRNTVPMRMSTPHISAAVWLTIIASPVPPPAATSMGLMQAIHPNE